MAKVSIAERLVKSGRYRREKVLAKMREWFETLNDEDLVEFSNWFDGDPSADTYILEILFEITQKRGLPW